MASTIQQLLLAERRKRVPLKDIERARAFKTPSIKAVETSYNVGLQRVQREINKETRKLLRTSKGYMRLDADDSVDTLFKAVAQMVARILNEGQLHWEAVRAEMRTSAVNHKKYDKGLYKGLGINRVPQELTNTMRDNWIKRNIGLITKTNANQVAALEGLFRDNAFSGMRAKDFEASLNKIFKGSKNNVAVIARDQVNKLNGQLDMMKQTEVGIPGYYWRTARDERVRLDHAMREGKYYRWDRPPAGGEHPGQEIMCRCDAEPAVDKMLMTRKEFTETKPERDAENAKRRKQAVARAEEGVKERKVKRKRRKA